MIDQLDSLLRYLFKESVPHLKVNGAPAVLDQQIRFEPPDAAFRGSVANIPVTTPTRTLKGSALNAYLVDLRENRQLRSNERVRTESNGVVVAEPAPTRLDCHYLITAWSPTSSAWPGEPAVEEQVLLYETLGALLRNAPLNPSRIYPPDVPPGSSPLAGVSEAIKHSDLPTAVIPPEGYPKLPEFWGAMGGGGVWKPAIWLIVTLPVVLVEEIVGEPVTTELVGYGLDGGPIDETRVTVGVEVVHAGAAVPGAWVRLETPGGVPIHEAFADGEGRLVFADVAAGGYLLQARTDTLGDAPPTTVQIPSLAGGYRVSFP